MSSKPISFSGDFLVLVESDDSCWWIAKDWQKREFIKAMRFGSMKTMCYPNPHTESDIFKENGYRYRFVIKNDWGPVYIENLDTNKKREIKYLELKKSDFSN